MPKLICELNMGGVRGRREKPIEIISLSEVKQ